MYTFNLAPSFAINNRNNYWHRYHKITARATASKIFHSYFEFYLNRIMDRNITMKFLLLAQFNNCTN
jgi:hypothetical protein